MTNQINLAPKASHEDEEEDELAILPNASSDLHLSQSHSTSPTNARNRTNSSSSVTSHSTSAGNADTRRRITKLKAREQEKTRLVEYFCVVSSVPAEEGGQASVVDVKACPLSPGMQTEASTCNATNNDGETDATKLDGAAFAPAITSRYPLADHSQNPFQPDAVTAFCFPSGQIPIEEREKMPKAHYFVTTGERGQSMYGTCLTFWEGHEVTVRVQKKVTTPKANGKKSKAERAMEAPVYNKNDFLSPVKVTPGGTQIPEQTATKVVYLPKCLVLLSMHPYLVAFREYLTQLHRLSKLSPSNSAKNAMTLPIERYITNFCSEIPAPPPGSFQVQTTLLDSVISIWSPPHNMPIQWVSLPFAHLFQCLDVENVLKVWTCLALERQVLITSTQLSLLTTCCEIFLSLLFPMKWTHAYIPVLPHFLVPILSAPMPFLCGIDKRYLAHTLEDLSQECIVVDLDKNQVSLGVKTPPLPSLPNHIYKALYNKLDEKAGCVYREVRSLRRSDNTSEMGFYLPPEVKSMADALWESRLCLFDEAFMLMFTPEERKKNWLNGEESATGTSQSGEEVRIMTLKEKNESKCWQSQWDAVQEAFLETYCYLLRSYRKYLVFPSKKGVGGDGAGGAYGGGFRSSEFLAGQRVDVREFLEELVGSQMFDDFVTKRLYGSGSFDISFFDSAVDRYVKNQSLIATLSGGGKIRSRLLGNNPDAPDREPPLLQSVRVRRKLKTIVPPEPCGIDLPETSENALVVKAAPKLPVDEDEDEELSHVDESSYLSPDSVPRILAAGTDTSSIASTGTPNTPLSPSKGPVYYTYPTFPERLDPNLFGNPRPMSSAVMAEYDRQREKAGKFRRVSSLVEESDNTAAQNLRRNTAITGQLAPVEKPASSEVTTFTVFFLAFTAVMGKDLVSVDHDSLNKLDSKSILSTYVKPQNESKQIANLVDEIVMLGVDDDDLPQTPNKEKRHQTFQKSPPRNRFNEKLSTLKIMEARETAKAELGIAFEMLKMMKERGLRADPEAFECLIDACGRCGDTDRATQLLSRMHEDGIVADGVVYSSLVTAFSAENAWKRVSGEFQEELPEWANGASMDMDWNTLKFKKRSYIDIVKEKFGAVDENSSGEAHPAGLRNTFNRIMSRNKSNQPSKGMSHQNTYTEQFVTDQILRQILLGENLLEIVYPDISIDTDNEFCPRCNFYLSDDDVVAGWTAGNSQEYKTQCPNCLTSFVPHFCVQSTLPSFVGSKGPSSPLLCERLSPWVLKKELRSVISGGVEDLLSPEWREKDTKNAVLWWNLILSFMRYRFPFTMLLQGSFSSSLIAPTPDDDLPLSP